MFAKYCSLDASSPGNYANFSPPSPSNHHSSYYSNSIDHCESYFIKAQRQVAFARTLFEQRRQFAKRQHSIGTKSLLVSQTSTPERLYSNYKKNNDGHSTKINNEPIGKVNKTVLNRNRSRHSKPQRSKSHESSQSSLPATNDKPLSSTEKLLQQQKSLNMIHRWKHAALASSMSGSQSADQRLVPKRCNKSINYRNNADSICSNINSKNNNSNNGNNNSSNNHNNKNSNNHNNSNNNNNHNSINNNNQAIRSKSNNYNKINSNATSNNNNNNSNNNNSNKHNTNSNNNNSSKNHNTNNNNNSNNSNAISNSTSYNNNTSKDINNNVNNVKTNQKFVHPDHDFKITSTDGKHESGLFRNKYIENNRLPPKENRITGNNSKYRRLKLQRHKYHSDMDDSKIVPENNIDRCSTCVATMQLLENNDLNNNILIENSTTKRVQNQRFDAHNSLLQHRKKLNLNRNFNIPGHISSKPPTPSITLEQENRPTAHQNGKLANKLKFKSNILDRSKLFVPISSPPPDSDAFKDGVFPILLPPPDTENDLAESNIENRPFLSNTTTNKSLQNNSIQNNKWNNDETSSRLEALQESQNFLTNVSDQVQSVLIRELSATKPARKLERSISHKLPKLKRTLLSSKSTSLTEGTLIIPRHSQQFNNAQKIQTNGTCENIALIQEKTVPYLEQDYKSKSSRTNFEILAQTSKMNESDKTFKRNIGIPEAKDKSFVLGPSLTSTMNNFNKLPEFSTIVSLVEARSNQMKSIENQSNSIKHDLPSFDKQVTSTSTVNYSNQPGVKVQHGSLSDISSTILPKVPCEDGSKDRMFYNFKHNEARKNEPKSGEKNAKSLENLLNVGKPTKQGIPHINSNNQYDQNNNSKLKSRIETEISDKPNIKPLQLSGSIVASNFLHKIIQNRNQVSDEELRNAICRKLIMKFRDRKSRAKAGNFENEKGWAGAFSSNGASRRASVSASTRRSKKSDNNSIGESESRWKHNFN